MIVPPAKQGVDLRFRFNLDLQASKDRYDRSKTQFETASFKTLKTSFQDRQATELLHRDLHPEGIQLNPKAGPGNALTLRACWLLKMAVNLARPPLRAAKLDYHDTKSTPWPKPSFLCSVSGVLACKCWGNLERKALEIWIVGSSILPASCNH